MSDVRGSGGLEAVWAEVARILATSLGKGAAEPLMTELLDRAAAMGDLAEGTNPPRTDFGEEWDGHRGRAYVQTEKVGAVHLELGSWRAFPTEHVRHIVEADELAEFIRLDSDSQWDAELIADARAIPLRSGSVDRVASNSTLEHIPHPHEVLAESHRVLRPGGVMVVAMPFVWPEHGYPEDHVRLTRLFFERVLPEIGFVDVHVDRDGSSGLYYALHQASKLTKVDAARPESEAMREIQQLVNRLLGLLIPLDRYFEDGSREWYQSVRVVARKAGTYEPSRRARNTEGTFVERCIDLLADPQTKRPMTRDGHYVVAEGTGTRYRHTRGSIDFLQPRHATRPLRDTVRDAARRAKRRTTT